MSDRPASTTALPAMRWRTFLQVISMVIAIEVALHAFIVKEPVVTLIVAIVWLAGALWVRSGGRGGPITIVVLSLFEIAGTFLFKEEAKVGPDTLTWILIIHVVLVSAALLAAVMTLRGRPRVQRSA